MVTDGYNVFSALDIGNYLIIHSPPNVAGFYLITSIIMRIDILSVFNLFMLIFHNL